jgi:hypothetical protein
MGNMQWKAVLTAPNGPVVLLCTYVSSPTHIRTRLVCTAGIGVYIGFGRKRGHAKDAAAHEYLVANGIISALPLQPY